MFIASVAVCRPPMHQCEVTVTNDITEGSSLHLENKGAGGDDGSSTSPVVTPAGSTNPGICLLLSVA